jgi:hypothetical protein
LFVSETIRSGNRLHGNGLRKDDTLAINFAVMQPSW